VFILNGTEESCHLHNNFIAVSHYAFLSDLASLGASLFLFVHPHFLSSLSSCLSSQHLWSTVVLQYVIINCRSSIPVLKNKDRRCVNITGCVLDIECRLERIEWKFPLIPTASLQMHDLKKACSIFIPTLKTILTLTLTFHKYMQYIKMI